MGERKIEERNGYIVVMPDDQDVASPLECPVCDVVMGTREDMMNYNVYGCCSWCKDMFVRGTIAEQRWRSGWRPPKAQVRQMTESMGIVIKRT